MKKILFPLFFGSSLYGFDQVGFMLGGGSLWLYHPNAPTEQVGYINCGGVITYPWFETGLFSSAVVDFMVHESQTPLLYDPTNTSTTHGLGLTSTLGFNLGLMVTESFGLYGGVKYANLSLSGISGEGFGVSLNMEWNIEDTLDIGLAYKTGTLLMYLSDEEVIYESLGFYLNMHMH